MLERRRLLLEEVVLVGGWHARSRSPAVVPIDPLRRQGGEAGVAATRGLIDNLGHVTRVDGLLEVDQMIDERAGMGAVGDMQRYMAYKAARAMEAAAENPGEAGNAAGLGLPILEALSGD